jgi:hypothetical protein
LDTSFPHRHIAESSRDPCLPVQSIAVARKPEITASASKKPTTRRPK